MKVLVVGGSGLVGAAAARSLQRRGAEVYCLSRSGGAEVGTGVQGDVRKRNLGLGVRERRRLLDGLTHVVSSFSSVNPTAGPQDALDVHRAGTANVLRFAAGSRHIERVVHVSSVLVFGRSAKRVDNTHLAVGQRFRNFYEYGKFLAEQEVRAFSDVPTRVVRLGDMLGTGLPFVRSAQWGIAAAIPTLLRGYPVHVTDHGRFPVFAGEAGTAGEVLARAAVDPEGPPVWTWFDDRLPTLAEVMTGLCSAFGVMPKLVEMRALKAVGHLVGPMIGLRPEILAYTEPWVNIDPGVLAELPDDLPRCPDGYIERAGQALHEHASHLGAIGLAPRKRPLPVPGLKRLWA
jgi:nucleoside-diphosphate-sugar epimerase